MRRIFLALLILGGAVTAYGYYSESAKHSSRSPTNGSSTAARPSDQETSSTRLPR